MIAKTQGDLPVFPHHCGLVTFGRMSAKKMMMVEIARPASMAAEVM